MPSRKNKQSPSFEQALEELEQMVETMESGTLPLEKLIASYERGAELISHCETVLGDAKKRLELLTATPTETPTAKPEQATYNDDEIRLF